VKLATCLAACDTLFGLLKPGSNIIVRLGWHVQGSFRLSFGVGAEGASNQTVAVYSVHANFCTVPMLLWLLTGCSQQVLHLGRQDCGYRSCCCTERVSRPPRGPMIPSWHTPAVGSAYNWQHVQL